MKKIVSNLLIAIALVLIIFPSVKSEKEIRETHKRIKEIEENSEKAGDMLLRIDKIDLVLPVNGEVNHNNLRCGVATLKNDRIVEGKNFALAGHRNIRRGKNLNRLNELELGDSIVVYNSKKEYEFKVSDKKIVKPNEGDVLKDSDMTEITLVTCHPIGVSSHRLIVKGEIVNE